MSRASVARAVVALVVAVGSVALTASRAGFPLVGGAIGVRVGSPGAIVEFTRAFLPIVVAVLLAVLSIRFGIRALRRNQTVRADFVEGGKLLATTAWAAWTWLVVELLYRQLYLGWATLFGDLGRSLAWSAGVVAGVVLLERFVPWARAPRGVRHVGLLVVVVVAVLTAWSAWSHRNLVTWLALSPVALVGLGLVASGVQRVESGPRARAAVELGLASALLAGPLWRLVA
jgi:hypothetical protein